MDETAVVRRNVQQEQGVASDAGVVDGQEAVQALDPVILAFPPEPARPY